MSNVIKVDFSQNKTSAFYNQLTPAKRLTAMGSECTVHQIRVEKVSPETAAIHRAIFKQYGQMLKYLTPKQQSRLEGLEYLSQALETVRALSKNKKALHYVGCIEEKMKLLSQEDQKRAM